MRIALLLGTLAAAAFTSAQPGLAAYEGPWCAHRLLGAGFVENHCSMRTYEMCREYIFATGGAWCTQNPRYQGPPEDFRPRKTKRPPR